MTLFGLFLTAIVAGIAAAIGRADMQSRLRRERASDTSQMFKDYFAPANVPDRVLEVVYKKLSNEMFWRKRFPVRPKDPLDYVYAVGPGCPNDLDLLIRELAGRCGFAIVPSERSMIAPTTVEELVHYLATLYSETLPEKDKTTLLRSSELEAKEVLLHAVSAVSSDPETLVRLPE